jgi:CHAD domain-containing protein
MTDGKRLLASFTALWQKYRKRLSACRKQPDEEAVHSLRISCRRLLALIQLLQTLAPGPSLRKLRKALKAQLDNFDELRDTQVMLLEIADRVLALPGLEPYRHYLQQNELRLLRQANETIAAIDGEALQDLFEKAEKNLASELGSTEIRAAILRAVDGCYRVALERYQAVDGERYATMHTLRIAVKKLRYMQAAAQELLPALPEHHLQQIQVYLTRLGEIQNSCVLQDNLNRFFGHRPPEDIQRFYRERHAVLVQDFLQHGSELMQFWRITPQRDFPWHLQAV